MTASTRTADSKPSPAAHAAGPWAYIAHRDGYWCGVASSELPKRDLNSFIGEFIRDGFSIMTVFSRAEYLSELAKLKYWHDKTNPAAKAEGR